MSECLTSPQNPIANVESDAEHLRQLVDSLKAECLALRESLARTEHERDVYLKALYKHLRPKLCAEEVDVDELRKQSAGPIDVVD